MKLSAPNGTLRILTREPVVGSVVLAMESSGMRVDQKVLDNLSQGKVLNTIG